MEQLLKFILANWDAIDHFIYILLIPVLADLGFGAWANRLVPYRSLIIKVIKAIDEYEGRRPASPVLSVLLVLLLVACSGMQKLPSVCDDIKGPSYLCLLADEAGVDLESIGAALEIADVVARGEGLYTPNEALKVIDEMDAIITEPVTYAYAKAEFDARLGAYAGMFRTVKTNYLDRLVNVDEILAEDRRILKGWFEKQRERLREFQGKS